MIKSSKQLRLKFALAVSSPWFLSYVGLNIPPTTAVVEKEVLITMVGFSSRI